MMRKLAQLELVEHTPYQGVRLLPAGEVLRAQQFPFYKEKPNFCSQPP